MWVSCDDTMRGHDDIALNWTRHATWHVKVTVFTLPHYYHDITNSIYTYKMTIDLFGEQSSTEPMVGFSSSSYLNEMNCASSSLVRRKRVPRSAHTFVYSITECSVSARTVSTCCLFVFSQILNGVYLKRALSHGHTYRSEIKPWPQCIITIFACIYYSGWQATQRTFPWFSYPGTPTHERGRGGREMSLLEVNQDHLVSWSVDVRGVP